MSVQSEQAPLSMLLRMYRGDDYGLTIVLMAGDLPADLTGVDVLAQVRPTPDSDEVSATFSWTVAENSIVLALTPDEVAAVPDRSVWDCELLMPDGTIRTVAYGPVRVHGDVSRV